MPPDTLPTHAEDMFCFGIYTASHVVNRAYSPHLKQLGLTYPQYITLTLLWERDAQQVTNLANSLRMGTSTLTPLLMRLELLGHVKRQTGQNDGRKVIVSLTAKGKALQKKAPNITACMVDGTSLKRSELETLQRLLGKLCIGLAKE